LTNDTYVISGLSTGIYKVFFDVAPNTKPYISEFYNGCYKFDLTGAQNISVTQGEPTDQINVTIDIGGIIEGNINLSNGLPVGADTLYESLVILYDNLDGDYIRDKVTTFCGGYRIKGIPAGDYKLCVLPLIDNNAVTYYGGGDTSNNPMSDIVRIQPNMVSTAEITLEKATGSISGKVVKDTDLMPMNLVYIMAYDESGHAVSAGVSGIDLGQNIFNGDGIYKINGLRNGTYYLRSWIIFALHPYFTDYLDLHYNWECLDEWYEDILVETDLISNSYYFYLLNFRPPFHQEINPDARSITLIVGNNCIHSINEGKECNPFMDCTICSA